MWLVDKIPQAHIFSVPCKRVLTHGSDENLDKYVLGENLISDLLQANIRQVSNCLIVSVGHSIGGLVIKELCCQAHDQLHDWRLLEDQELYLSGVFYYATPHHGSSVADRLTDITGGSVLKYFKTLSTDTKRLNSTFDRINKVHDKWLFAGLGEGFKTNMGWFRDVMVVPEASGRGDNFNAVEGADHFSVRTSRSKTSRSFSRLKDFLTHIANEMKDEVTQNFQRLPMHMTGISDQLQELKGKLEDITELGLVGMGGSGKTTLAMAIFNELFPSFEYTCFVRDMKHIIGTNNEVKEKVWTYMHFKGKKVGNGEVSIWRGERVLLVLDDISGSHDESVLLDIAELMFSKSGFIVTTRERDSVQRLGTIYNVQLLNEYNSQSLFMNHAFPDQAFPPPNLASLTGAIVMKCEGLPLTLEILGQKMWKTGSKF